MVRLADETAFGKQADGPARGRGKASTDGDRRVGEIMRRERKLAGVSQGTLGSSIGVTFQQIQKYENGTNRVSSGRLAQIASALNLPIERFYPDVPDAAERTSTPVMSDEALAVVRSFIRIKDPQVRKQVRALLKALAEAAAG